jgi:two-component system NtrC family sensor kinase
MDLPLRTRLLGALMAVVVVLGSLAMLVGWVLINRMVIGEAERRVSLALKTAHALLDRRLEESAKACAATAAAGLDLDSRAPPSGRRGAGDQDVLDKVRKAFAFDFLHAVDTRGRIVASARGIAAGSLATSSPVVKRCLEQRSPVAAISLLPQEDLRRESEVLFERARILALPTPHARPGGRQELSEVTVLEAAAPVFDSSGDLVAAIRAGTVLNGNFELVDFVRENIFTTDSYKGKSYGTVTVFQDDVRITTNVIGPDGRRAIGTRVSAEVYDRVLVQGKTWTGPAFVVDTWYLSAYEPLYDIQGKRLGMLYVGVIKKRYDDMRNQAISWFMAAVLVAFVAAVFLSLWLSARLTRPLGRLTAGAAQVARGNLECVLPSPAKAERDEIYRLTLAFNQMVTSLKEGNEALLKSRDDLQQTADQLHQWVQNYLETLEFITHELKNQIAAMKINLLAVRDGYVGTVTAEQREALEDVLAAIHRAEEMILNYLNLSRIEKGELKVRMRPTAVEADVVRPVLTNLKSRLEAKQMTVEVDIPEDLLVQADPALLQIVYENLLSNAVKYGRPSGRIRVTGRRTNASVSLHVWNDGPGVPEGQLGKLFSKFVRLEPPSVQERGTGLGLFITKELIRRQGGDIRVESAYGEWIDFIFTLPVPDALLPPADTKETPTS